MRRTLAFTLALVIASSACSGDADEHERAVRAAIASTKQANRSFVYRTRSADAAIVISGAIEDDYRYKVSVDVDGTPTLEEVVSDDTLAVRVANPARVGLFLAPPRSPQTGQALLAGRWVLDADGAPDIVRQAGGRSAAASNPVQDALTALSYLERAMRAADFVIPFNPESLEYRASEDTFPAPEKGAGVKRYDLIPPASPRTRSGPGTFGARAEFEATNFRRMAIYVKDGRVLEAREAVFISPRQVKDVARYYGIKLSGDLAAQSEQALAALNRLRHGVGSTPITPRVMQLQILDLGKVKRVALPKGAVTGQVAPVQTGSTSGT